MKLLQLNVWNGRLEQQITDLLQQEHADIVCLQEAISLEGESGLFLTLEAMQEASGLPHSIVGPVFSFNYMQRVASFSNCIFSRFPIQKSKVFFTNLAHKESYDLHEHKTANMRNVIHAVIDIGSQSLNVLTHHGYHIPHHKNGDKETLRQMENLSKYVSVLEGPVILTGDFNLAPHSESLEQINKVLQNLSIRHELKTTRTLLTRKTEVCDYIFVNDKVQIKNFKTSDEIVSDHKALILDFNI